MRFSSGVLVGLAVGYYLGAKAGRERYEDIERWLDRVRATGGYQDARARVVDLVGDPLSKGRDPFGGATPMGPHPWTEDGGPT